VRPNLFTPAQCLSGEFLDRLEPLIESNYSELVNGDEPMTLCIATASQYKEKAAFAFCSDTRSLSGTRDWGLTISAENADKARWFSQDDRFAAVIAGHPTAGDELLTLCNPAIKTFAERPEYSADFDLFMNDLFEGLRSAARTRMKQIQDHYIATNSPFKGSDDFLLRAKSALPETQYRELWHDIATLTLGTEVIIGGIHSGQPILIKIDNKGHTHWEDQYSVIGTGSAEALAFLAQNDYDENEIRLEDSLMRMVETLDFVSTANNTVGHESRFNIYLEDGTSWDLEESFFEEMKSKIRLAAIVDLGDCGDFLEGMNQDEVSSERGEEITQSADAGNELSSGSGSGGAEGGDSAPSGGVSGDGSE
jgi:hypothetical protein